jgi:dTDP-4-amino-4,6-dideoxygalactose transaminase
VDLAAQHAPLKAKLLEAIADVIDEGQFILGRQVADFEEEFAVLCGVRHAVALNSGTDALVLALEAVGVGPGDEVITVPNSFVASTACIARLGARPVLVDVGADYNIDPAKIEPAITPRTKAILPVHLTGRPCEMDRILAIAQAHGLAVVEDCAQAVLAEYKGRRVGSFGAAGCFSLHPLKTLNACGDGGALTTNDTQVYERLRLARNHGLRSRDDCAFWSGNSRLDTMQAAILLVKLRHLEEWTERRRANARIYRELLTDIPEVRVPRDVDHIKPVYHTLVVQAEGRNELRGYLSARGIETAIHYPVPIHLSAAATDLGFPKGSFPVAEQQAGRILSLPIYPELTESQINRVCDSIRAFYGYRPLASCDEVQLESQLLLP